MLTVDPELAERVEGRLKANTTEQGPLEGREAAIVDYLRERGASFFGQLHEAVGGGYPAETVDALWGLVWKGIVTNDTFHALRAFTRAHAPRRKARRQEAGAFRSRRLVPPSAEGRWALVPTMADTAELKFRAKTRATKTGVAQLFRPARVDATKWASAAAQQLLARHGVVTREAVAAEAIPGGFGTIYPVLKAMEETGRLRRGYFVAGLGATQFALPGTLDLLRSLRAPTVADVDDAPEVAVLAATDPANPYGATLRWPAFAADAATAGQARAEAASTTKAGATARQALTEAAKAGRGPTRTVGATVILVNGALAAYLARGDRQLITYLPDAEPERSRFGGAVARVLIERARTGGDSPRGMLVEEIDGVPPSTHPMAAYLTAAGFIGGALGFQATFKRLGSPKGPPLHNHVVDGL